MTGIARLRIVVAISLSLLGDCAAASVCQRDAQEAFDRLAKSGHSYRRETTETRSRNGAERFEFVPPDRVRWTVTPSADLGFGVVRVGKRLWQGAWNNVASKWGEARNDPSYELTLAFSYTQRTVSPSDLTFVCLGSVEYSGKSLIGYRAQYLPVGMVTTDVIRPASPSQEPPLTSPTEPPLWLTIFVDPDTRMLTYEIIAEDEKLDKLRSLTRYTYLTDITIEPPR